MIESNNTNELRGQYELSDLLPGNEGTGNSEQGTGIPEGYDEEGHLLNVDWPEIGGRGATSSVTAKAATPSPKGEGKDTGEAFQKPSPLGEGGSAQALTEEVDPTGIPQTSAQDEARLAALATEINTITEQARGAVISAALAVGKRLIEARSLCPEGRFGQWLAASVSYSERKAQDMMRLYVEYGRDGAIPDSIAALDYSKAVALLSAPAEQRDALAAQAAEEGLSVRQLQQEIKRLKDEAAQAQQQIEWHENMKERLDNNINEVENNLDEVERQLEAKDDELKAAKRVIADAAEKVSLANAKAAAAEASAEELRKLHSDAEDRAAQSAQRASDAVNRANQVAKDLAEARAKIAELREQGTGNREQEWPRSPPPPRNSNGFTPIR